MFRWKRKRRIYLDFAASTPVRKGVFSAMIPYLRGQYGNPSAVHAEGLESREAIEKARKSVAKLLHVREEGVVFTGSGTEANNLAVYGVLREFVESGKSFEDIEIITTDIEHPSIENAATHLASHGAIIRRVSVDENGQIDENHFQSLLGPKTLLVTFAYVNSEIGVVQNVNRLSRIVRKYNQEHNTKTMIHLDASQAPLWLSCEVDRLGVDLMTLDAHKCYGPKGVGVLAFRHGIELKSFILGGGQEGGLRAGTENTAAIVGCSVALEVAQESWKTRSEKVTELRDFLINSLQAEIEGVVLNGSTQNRVANNVNISIPGVDTEFAVVTLDAHGIAASTQSACGGMKGGGSRVVRNVTGDEARATSTIRFSLGEETKKSDLEKTVSILKEHVQKMRIYRERK